MTRLGFAAVVGTKPWPEEIPPDTAAEFAARSSSNGASTIAVGVARDARPGKMTAMDTDELEAQHTQTPAAWEAEHPTPTD